MTDDTARVIRLTDEEDDIGNQPVELGPKDKARLALASRVLLAVLLVVIISLAAVIWCPFNRLAEVKEFVSFVKTVAPPLITLVIGFYFNAQGDSA
jgi:purine-cytosine permease-like protein